MARKRLTEITAVFLSERWRSPDEDSDFVIANVRLVESIATLENNSPGNGLAKDCQLTILGDAKKDDLQQSLSYRFYGAFERNQAFGMQFKFTTYVRSAPHGRAGVVRYLQLAPNIGPVIASALWAKFSSDAVRILRESPEVASAAVSRFSLEVAEAAASFLKHQQSLENVTIDLIDVLGGRGFPKGTAKAAVEKWGNQAAEVVKSQPFELMLSHFPGCGFSKTDAMYCDLGLPPADLKRQAFCGVYTIGKECEKNGHTWIPIEMIAAGIRAKVGAVDVTPVEAVRFGVNNKLISIFRDGNGKLWAADYKHSSAEDAVARYIAEAMNERDECVLRVQESQAIV